MEVSTRIHMLDDGTITSIYFIGTLDDYGDDFWTDPAGAGTLGQLKYMRKQLNYSERYMALFLTTYTGFELTYYRNNPDAQMAVITATDTSPTTEDWHLEFPIAGDETKEKLNASEEVQDMGVWPAADSVKVIGDAIVVKLSN